MNQLYYGDNLEILRTRIPDESVDLIYIDPPFSSNQVYKEIQNIRCAPQIGRIVEMRVMVSRWGNYPRLQGRKNHFAYLQLLYANGNSLRDDCTQG